MDEKLYQDYTKFDREERYWYESEKDLVFSLDRMGEEGIQYSSQTDRRVEAAEEAALRNVSIGELNTALENLSPDEKNLILQISGTDSSLRKLAQTLDMKQKTLLYRRDKIIEKIALIMEVEIS